jgi:AcrR family transcriptional regulator
VADPTVRASAKPERILAAAGELLLGRGSKGVTIAEVARKAHIGKGTVYLYWKTKEDLLLDLVCRDFLALSSEIIAAVTADPDLARPSRLCADMLRAAAAHPYVSALQRGDDGLLGVLTDDPRSARLLDTLGTNAVLRRILPIWRANGLAATEWSLTDQAFALHALVAGFSLITGGLPQPQLDDAERVLGAAVIALLGPDQATSGQVEAAATEGLRVLAEERAVVQDLLAQPGGPDPVASV